MSQYGSNLNCNLDRRGELLETLVKLYKELKTPDYVQMCQCLIFLDQPMPVSDILGKLLARVADM